MSQENIGLYKRAIEALNRRELSDAIFEELCTADFSMTNTASAVTDRTYRAADGARQWLSDFFDAFDEGARLEVEEIVAAEDDFVVGVVRLSGRGARSSAPLVLRWVNVNWIRDGKIARAVGYTGRGGALQAVGLGE